MISVETSNRLAKLVPLLGSNIEGEVLAAVGAIGRVLAKGAADWHDLAEALTQVEEEVIVFSYPSPRPGPRTAEPPQRAPEPPPKPKRQHRAPPDDDGAYAPLRRTFSRTPEAREFRRAILIMLSVDGAPIKSDERIFMQHVADECYRLPHVEIGREICRRLDTIRRRVLKHLAAQSEHAA